MNDRDDLHEADSRPPNPLFSPPAIPGTARVHRGLLTSLVAVCAVSAVLLFLVIRSGGQRSMPASGGPPNAGRAGSEPAGERVVVLSNEALDAADIETEIVSERPLTGLLRTTGTVESNQEQTQQVTPLVSGRVERVNVAVGAFVRAGSSLAVLSSPEVAELVGKLREAETRLVLAIRGVERVRRAENRANALSARARLDEAEATLIRTRRLVELGVSATRDLVAAETMYRTAKADYEYQSVIAFDREVQEAQAEVETATTEVNHLRESIRSLGGGEGRNISEVTLRAPNSGRVTERLVNVGAGVQAGSPMFTIGDLSSMWVIARVPESQVNNLRTGSPAVVRTPEPGADPINGRIDYIDPALDESTRTARVRVEVPNPDERLKAGMFVEVDFHGAAGAAGARELVVPAAAVQRIGDRTVVFIEHADEPGHFEVREVELGGEIDGFRRVITGLSVGERVVTSGSFTLKTQMMRGEMGEHGH